MDPNEALAQLRTLASKVSHEVETLRRMADGDSNDEEIDQGQVVADLAMHLASQFWALDEWLMRGGYAPHAWRLLDVQWRDHDLGPDEARSIPEPHHYTVAEIKDGSGFAPDQTFVADPLGGPVPGVNDHHLPERTPEGSEMESQYPRDFEDGEGIHRPSYGE